MKRNGSSLAGACRLALALLSCLTSTYGQEQATSRPVEGVQASQPAETLEAVASEITAETIQARITQTETATGLAETVKAEVLGLYRQALDQLAVADNWAKQVAKYQVGREQAPDLLAVVTKRIEAATTQPATGPSDGVSADTSLAELDGRLSDARAQLKNRLGEAQKLEDEAKTRLQRKALIPDLLGTAKQRLEGLVAELSASPAPGVAPQVAQARRTLLMAQKQAVEEEISAYEEELRFYDDRTDLLAARRKEANQLASAAQAQVTRLDALLSERRKAELEKQRQQAERELQTAPRVVRELAEGNAELLREREAVDKQIDTLEAKTKIVTDLTGRLTREFEFLQKNIDQDQKADLGPLMRMSRDELAGLRGYEADLRANKNKYAEVRLRAWEMDEEWLIPVDTRVKQIMDELRDSRQPLNLARLEPRVRELVESRRTSLEQSKKFFGTYESRLRELVAAEEVLAAKVSEFAEFIEEHVFSVRSVNPIHKTTFPREWYAFEQACTAFVKNVLADVRDNFPVYILAAVALTLLLASKSGLRRRLHDLSPLVVKASTDSYRLTLIALLYTFLLAIPYVALLWFAAERAAFGAGEPEGDAFGVGQAVSAGLRSAMWLMLILGFARHVFRPKGLADVHFRWDSSAVRLVRTNLIWLTPTLLLAWFVVSATERYLDSAWRESLGRLAFAVAMISVSVCAQRLLRPAGTLVAVQFRKGRSKWLYGLRYFWYSAGTAVPLVLIILSLLGYHYTAVVLAEQMAHTILLFLLLSFIHSMMVRWVLVAQRRLAIEQARMKRAAAETSGDQSSTSETAEPEEIVLDIGGIGSQTRTLMRSAVFLGALIGSWVIWSDMLPALGFLEEVKLWSYTVQTSVAESGDEALSAASTQVKYVTLHSLLVAIILALATLVLAKNIPGLLEITVLQRVPLDVGGRYAITALVRYLITVVGAIIAFGAVGIGWSKVQWLVAAMTVGLGFGLQEIFANFVSGLMLLFERPIRVGDTVTVGEVSGTVARIRIRATTITGWDRKELVIPNKEFVTGQVVNWTLSDSILRLVLPVGIAYGSDTQRAREVLMRIAREHPCVIADPEPRVLFMGFGDSSLDFELRVFIGSIDHFLQTRDEVNNRIDQEFRKAGIEIAFPQRDLHLRSVKATLPIANEASGIEQVTGRQDGEAVAD